MEKIIAFISMFSRAFSLSAPGDVYLCPDGRTVPGKHTNEAPIRYLLKAHPQIREVLCIVSKQALEIDEAIGSSPFDYICNMVHDEAPDAECVQIRYTQSEDFEKLTLPEILKNISAADRIYLETTGGFRDTTAQLMLLSRVLQFQKTELAGAVYSRFETKQVTDVTDSYRMFDVITGLNDFQRFCNADTLKQYFANKKIKSIELNLFLTAMENLSESMIMCKTGQMNRCMDTFKKRLAELEKADLGDPILRIVLPVFSAKFENLNNIVDIIRWCLENNMLQQALTIYNERIPEYLIKDIGILTIPADYEEIHKEKGKKRDPYYDALMEFFFIGKDFDSRTYKDTFVKTVQCFEYIRKRQGFNINVPKNKLNDAKEVLMDYLYVNLLRNRTNHDGDDGQHHTDRSEDLNKFRYTKPENIKLNKLKQFLNDALTRLDKISSN